MQCLSAAKNQQWRGEKSRGGAGNESYASESPCPPIRSGGGSGGGDEANGGVAASIGGRRKDADHERDLRSTRKQIDTLERKVANARHLSDAHEKFAREAHEREVQSKAEAEKAHRGLRLTRERYQELESRAKMIDLRDSIGKFMSEIISVEKAIRELSYGGRQSLNAQAGALSDRRRLHSLRARLIGLRTQLQSQTKMLGLLSDRSKLSDDMRRAAKCGDASAVDELLSEGVGINIPDGTGFTAFKYACGAGHEEIAARMIGSADLDGAGGETTALIMAAWGGHGRIVRLLLSAGAASDLRDEAGNTALLVACSRGHNDCVEVLVTGGADFGIANKRGNTGLHFCAHNNFDEVADLLLENNAESNVKNAEGLTPLEISRAKRHQKMIAMLEQCI